ncbi:MAG: glycosyltransferase family 39 protein [Thermoleophilia bacterium]
MTTGALQGARAVRVPWHAVALGLVLALSATLNLWRLDRNGWGNEYYAGAVHSMLEGGSNLLFAAFDPGGLVAVDKTPLALWVQAGSAWAFGDSGMALLVPQALMGVASVGVLYLLVAGRWGRVAGLLAALALAVCPVFVAVSRDNNPDALFILLLLLALLTGTRAAASGRLRLLVLCGALVGLAFLTKMLLAAVVLPGLAAAYLLTAPHPLGTRVRHVALAAGAMAAVAATWVTVVALTPSGDRPWVGSTDDDSILGLVFGYNGVGRVAGQTGGTSTTGGAGGVFSGTPGPFRLLNEALGDQIGWLLPLALAGGLSLLLAVRRRRDRRQRGWLIAVGGWFAVTAAILSASDGIVHTYYTALLAPSLAALAGAGAVSLWRDLRRGGAWPFLPVGSVALTAGVQLHVLGRTGWLPALAAVVTVACLAGGVAVWAGLRREPRGGGRLAGAGLAVAMGALLLAPTAWAASAGAGTVSGVFPGAGPSFVEGLTGAGRGGGVAGTISGGAGTDGTAQALAWAEAHDPGTRWSLIVASEEEAAPFVVAGDEVAAMGGFTGRETVIAPSRLAAIVRSGEARWFLLGATRSFTGQVNPSTALIESACTPAGSYGGSTLYDCAGAADAIAAAA